mmetsp:Transcript_26659/g.55820  ORF Transcript_26659/g.55820 Transcript_26659/m.55820 type:complete len:161 (+) Transcript_26659:283-765(+)
MMKRSERRTYVCCGDKDQTQYPPLHRRKAKGLLFHMDLSWKPQTILFWVQITIAPCCRNIFYVRVKIIPKKEERKVERGSDNTKGTCKEATTSRHLAGFRLIENRNATLPSPPLFSNGKVFHCVGKIISADEESSIFMIFGCCFFGDNCWSTIRPTRNED